MKVSNIDFEATLYKACEPLESNSSLDPNIKSLIELFIVIISVLSGRFILDSKNSSKPPSQDPNRKKTPKNSGQKKPGGQVGRKGSTLKKIDNPDNVIELFVDRSKLPRGNYKQVDHKVRQVFNLEVKVIVMEYQAEILQGPDGKQYVAPFPPEFIRIQSIHSDQLP